MSEYGDKEQIHDQKISPLMDQIIDICKADGINMVASFQLQSEKEREDEGHLLCTTIIARNVEHFPASFKRFSKDIYDPEPQVIAIAVTKRGEAL